MKNGAKPNKIHGEGHPANQLIQLYVPGMFLPL
jgi:hypothetical protein